MIRVVGEPRLRGATNAKPDTNLAPHTTTPVAVSSCQTYCGFPESRMETKGYSRAGMDFFFTSHSVIEIPDPLVVYGWTGLYDLHGVSLLLTVGVPAACCPSIRNPISTLRDVQRLDFNIRRCWGPSFSPDALSRASTRTSLYFIPSLAPSPPL